MNSKARLEMLAEAQHNIWVSWIVRQLETHLQPDGTIVVPAEKVARWRELSETPYGELSEAEKEKDRVVVTTYLSEILKDGREE